MLCLLLTAILSFAHCDNGGGGGNGGGGDPEPEPIGPAIYLWIIGCTVPGDMSGDGMDGACDNMTRGVDGADSICGNRYTEDVPSEHRTTIMEQHETGALQQKAFLASSGGDSNLPQNFDINGKDSLPLRRPDGTQISLSWAAFFNGEQDLDNSIFGTDELYWTGLVWDSAMREFILASAVGVAVVATYHCDDWTTNTQSRDGGSNLDYGMLGKADQTGEGRFGIFGGLGQQRFCQRDRVLLCITH